MVHANNSHYLRMQALHALSKDEFRQDVISGDIAGYIIEGWDNLNARLVS